MNLLDAEKKVGMETFYTDFQPLNGKLKVKADDFKVEEISEYPPEENKGKFTIATIISKNWETNKLIRDISNRLHISRNRINFAGTKDKRAVTTQIISFYKVPKKNIDNLSLRNVEIHNIYNSNQPVKIGNLKGNSFDINIRHIKKGIKEKDVKQIVDFFNKKKVFPNFFGIQRFGIIRPITHIVGKYIIKGNIKKAVMVYIGNPTDEEEEDVYKARKTFEKTDDYAWALKNYPEKLNFEKAMLNKLVVNPEDYVSALKELPNNLLTMFIYAYQSYLFNKILSKRIKNKIPLDRAIIGDIILPIRKKRIENEYIEVNENNIEKVNLQIFRGKAVVSGVLFGTDSTFSEGEMGEIEHQVIDSEKIKPGDFIIPEIPFISSYGSRRPLFAAVHNIKYKLFKDDLNIGKKTLNLRFELKKGCYATSLLREFMKADNIRNY